MAGEDSLAVSVAETDGPERRAVDFERIRILYANQKFGYLGVITGAAMLYITAASFSSVRFANLWLSALVVANIPRLILSLLFERGLRSGSISPDTVKPWEMRMTVAAAAAYLGTVSSMFLPYGEHALTASLICALVFVLQAVGGVLMMSTSLPAIIIYLSMVTAAIVSRLLTLHDLLPMVLAVIIALGYLQILRLVFSQHRLLVENITLRIENTEFALFDPLTKLANRRQLEVVMDKLLPGAQRGGEVFSVILLDIDHFKDYNDSQGHNAGDEQLIKLAGILLECSRDPDVVVRYGGEEFLLVLPKTSVTDAEIVAERIRRTVDERTEVTISAGIAEYAGIGSFAELVQQAKNNGRDQVVVA